MANYEATRYDFDGANITGIEGVNTGIIIPWSSTSIPSGFLECDGTAVSRSTYSALFAVVGTTYGSGDGSTTFNLPDLQEKCCQNTSPTKSFATSGGSSTVTISAPVSGSIGNTTLTVPTIASHSHPSNLGATKTIFTSSKSRPGTSGSTGGDGAHSHPLSGANFAGNATSTLQPTITLVYIIKT
jgi:microcystin-dependent protein